MTERLNWRTAREHSITIVDGVRVGHWTDEEAATGCTAVVCERDAVAGVDVRGGATASREIELLDPCGLVDRVQGIMLSGGSAMGLACAAGAVEYFSDRVRGFATEQGVVPIVPGASLYDFGIGKAGAFPDMEDGFAACRAAGADFERGNVGAGTGAVVGKIRGHAMGTKGGLGSAGWETSDGLRVGAIAAVNAFGDVVDPETGLIIAGARSEDGALGTADAMIVGGQEAVRFGTNTTLCVIATNAKLTKTEATVVARIAQSGIARAVSPCHTQFDGDMVFVLSVEDEANDEMECDLNRVGVLASKMVEAAVIDAVLRAESAHGVVSARELGWVDRGSV